MEAVRSYGGGRKRGEGGWDVGRWEGKRKRGEGS